MLGFSNMMLVMDIRGTYCTRRNVDVFDTVFAVYYGLIKYLGRPRIGLPRDAARCISGDSFHFHSVPLKSALGVWFLSMLIKNNLTYTRRLCHSLLIGLHR